MIKCHGAASCEAGFYHPRIIKKASFLIIRPLLKKGGELLTVLNIPLLFKKGTD